MTAPDPQALIDGLRDITANLAGFVEEQAQLIARPRVAAAEQAIERRLDKMATAHATEHRRQVDLIAELRRHIAALDKHEKRLLDKVKRVQDVAADLDGQDLHAAANAIRVALNGTGTPIPARGGAR